MSAEVIAFPREGFIIDHKGHCMEPGPERHLMCFAPYHHKGEHQWDDWRGCRVRTKLPDGRKIVLPFGGFAG